MLVEITIKIKDKEITLSVQEAEELYRTLDKLFGEKRIIIPKGSPSISKEPLVPPWKRWAPYSL